MKTPKVSPNCAKDIETTLTDFARNLANIKFHNSNPFYKKFSN